MGTRGAYGFRVDGVDKIAYNQFDSYPDSLGRTMIMYCHDRSDEELRAIASGLVVIDGKTEATDEEVERYGRWCDTGVSRQTPRDWYCLLRAAQGDPEAWHRGLDRIEDSASFLADSLMCEWAYIVNLDDGTLEIYKGFNKDPKAPGRYARLNRNDSRVPTDYMGVRLLKAVPLALLRDLAAAGRRKLVVELENADSEDDE